jgi:hypothetical protein
MTSRVAIHHPLLEEQAVRLRVTVDDLRGPARHAFLVDARQMVVQELRGRGLSWKVVARILNRHPDSVRGLIRRPANDNRSAKAERGSRLRFDRRTTPGGCSPLPGRHDRTGSRSDTSIPR